MNTAIMDFFLSMTPDVKEWSVYGSELQLYDNLDTPTPASGSAPAHEYHYPLKLKFAASFFCHAGSLYLRVNLIDYRLQAGDCLSFISESIIDRFCMSADCRLVTTFFANNSDAALFDVDFTRFFLGQLLTAPIQVRLPPAYAQKYIETYRLLKSLLRLEDFRYRKESIQGCMKILACLTAQCIPARTHRMPNRSEEIFHSFLKEVREHYREHRELTFYADRLCISSKYLGKAIRDYCGRYPSDLIKSYVILEAKALLRSNRYTVKEISELLNFSNPSFFGKYFKEAVGCSPLKY